MSDLNIDTLCKVYVKIRTKKQELVKAHEEELEGLNAKLEQLSGAMKDMLATAGAKSIKTDHGTVYATTKTRYYPMDWGAFGNWVIENKAIDLLEKRVAQSNITKWLEDCPTNPPPGLQADTEQTVTVRKA